MLKGCCPQYFNIIRQHNSKTDPSLIFTFNNYLSHSEGHPRLKKCQLNYDFTFTMQKRMHILDGMLSNKIVDSISLPIEVNNSTIELHLPVDSQYSSPVEVADSISLSVEVYNLTIE